MYVFPGERGRDDAFVMVIELRKVVPGICFVIAGLLAAFAWNHPGVGTNKPGDWSPSAFLRISSVAASSRTADSTDPVWLQELEVIGVAAAGESIADPFAESAPRTVAQHNTPRR
jgi:hypothetical protein